MRLRALLIWSYLCYAGAAFASDTATPGIADFAVLTPALESRLIVATGLSPSDFLPIIDAFGDLATRGKSTRLRQLAAADRFDPARKLADRLLEALTEAGHAAALEEIARKPAGSIQSLSWSDLPETPQGKLMLDVTIRWLCLCRGVQYFDYAPAMALGWRVLDPRGEVVEPTRVLNYVHMTGWSAEPVESPHSRDATPPPEEPRYPEAKASESCKFRKVDDALDDPTVLWGCFGEAIDIAARRIVMDLDRARQSRSPVTASGDSPSGKSTQ